MSDVVATSSSRCCAVCGHTVETSEARCPLGEGYLPDVTFDAWAAANCLDGIVERERRDAWNDGNAA